MTAGVVLRGRRERCQETKMLCKNRITLIGFLGQDAETRSTPNGNPYARLSLATSVSSVGNSRPPEKKAKQTVGRSPRSSLSVSVHNPWQVAAIFLACLSRRLQQQRMKRRDFLKSTDAAKGGMPTGCWKLRKRDLEERRHHMLRVLAGTILSLTLPFTANAEAPALGDSPSKCNPQALQHAKSIAAEHLDSPPRTLHGNRSALRPDASAIARFKLPYSGYCEDN